MWVINYYFFFFRYGDEGGGIYKTHMFMSPSIIIRKPETCKRVLNDENNFRLGYPESMLTVAKTVLFEASSEDLRRFRRVVTSPIMGYNALMMFLERMEIMAVQSLEDMASKTMEEGSVELVKETKALSLRVILHVFMGSYNQNIMQQVIHLFYLVDQGLLSLPLNFPGFTYYRALRSRRKLIKIVKSVVEDRKVKIENGKVTEKNDLIDVLVDLEDEINGRKLKSEDIVDLLLLFLIAGHATTGAFMMWSLIYLTNNPLAFNKAKEEQEEIVKSRPASQKQLSVDEIKKMVYLSQVIDEVIRITDNAVPMFRVANNDVNINGYIVPKGWKVILWPLASYKDPQYFPNPREFNPSRWDDNNAKEAFLPFGAGIRQCPGRDVARVEILIFLHHFVLNYKLEQINPEFPISYLPVPVPKDNCLAKLIKVSSGIAA
ncbi:hypothetical protein PIB30_032913 [Stylosanthes scabra]|uniref:Uncharacterized protein n=1 Tax=Stylosanthes scabra TaxID=79078 RepID=A0ABU6VF93_9FABA|nr:hypothetical protein [Stylosanthes scabra]